MRQITVNDTGNRISLPNGLSYVGPTEVTLTDEEFSLLSDTIFSSGLLSVSEDDIYDRLEDLEDASGTSAPTVISVQAEADQTKSSDSTLGNDPELVLTGLEANTEYALTGCIMCEAASYPDFKFGFAIPTGGSCTWWAGGPDNGSILTDESGSQDLNGGSGIRGVGIVGTVTTDEAGDLTFQWAQNISDGADCTRKAGSWIRVEVLPKA